MTEEKYIKKYKELYKKKTGKDISDVDAVGQFMKLITLVKNVYQPIPAKDLDKYKKLLDERECKKPSK